MVDPVSKEQSAADSGWEDFVYAIGGLIFCAVDFVALLFLSGTAYGVQICTILGYTCFVAMHTFIRGRLGPGYSLPNRDDQPLNLQILSIHSIFCAGIFAAQTFVMRRWKSFPASWTAESGPKHDSGLSLVLIVLVVLV